MKKPKSLGNILPYLYSFGGGIGFLAAFTLAVEKIELLKNPAFEPSCNINPILSCGSVMVTPQAEVFGFPNPLIGIAGFAVITTIGIALFAGAKLNEWFWKLVLLGLIFAVGFIHWLFFQSVYRIEALCPYCMVVWSVTIPLFWYTLLYSLEKFTIKSITINKIALFARRHHGDILIFWYLIIIAAILNHFWYYWKTLV